MTSESESDSRYWVGWFLARKENDFFCEIDEDYIMDKFNLTGLSRYFESDTLYQLALDMINDTLGKATSFSFSFSFSLFFY